MSIHKQTPDQNQAQNLVAAGPPRAALGWQAAVDKTVTGLGYDLVDLERSAGGLLRVTIDRLPGRKYPAGEGEAINVDDCEAVTRQLQYVLEVEQCEYARLEVSSPGLDRPLRKPADWERFAGLGVDLTLKLPFEGRKKYRGRLVQCEGGWRLVLESDAAAKGRARPKAPAPPVAAVDRVLDFSLDEVREARLVPVVDFKGRKTRDDVAAEAGTMSAADDGGREE